MIAIGVAASTAGTIQLLAPLHLSDEGLSQSEIGWVFTATAAVSMGVALTMRRLAGRLDRLRTAMRALALVSVSLALMLLSLPTAAYIGVLLLIFLALAPEWVVSYPLCSEGAERAGLGQGVAMGALNTVWAVGALAAPALAGVIAEASDDRAAYGVALLVVLAGAGGLLRAWRADQRLAASSAGSTTGRRHANRSHT
jgi:MFS family permease